MELMEEKKVGFEKTEVGSIPADWNSKVISEIADVKSGKRLPKGFYLQNSETPQPYIRVTDMFNGGVELSDIQYVPKEAITAITNYKIFLDDLFISVAGTLGVVGEIPSELDGANLTENANRFTNIKCDKKYLLYVLLSPLIQNKIEEERTLGAQPKLALIRIRNFSIPLPPTLEEQQAIATALSDTDTLITGLEKVISKKKAIKQGAMQQLLTPPSKGGKRLPGFNGEWEEKSLGEVLKIRHGKDQKGIQDKNGKYPILGTGGLMGYTNDFLYDKDSVLIGRKGTIDKPQFMSTPFWTVDTLFYSEVFPTYNAKLVYYYFLLIDWRSKNEASGVPSLNASTVEFVKITISRDKEEQDAITDILNDMDKELQALEAKKAKYEQIKQGMMQELLTGKTRLV